MSSKFGPQTTALEVVEGLDLKNKDYVVTGASSGLGAETARALAKAGARVVLAVRDTRRGDDVANEIRESTKNPNVELEKLELDSLESVNEFVKRYLDKKRPLHGLINNAGTMGGPLSYTKDGFEFQFGTNYMGHFALTIGLLPALIEAYKQTGNKSRVINVSSIIHIRSDVHFDDINYRRREYDSLEAYGQSKTALVLFSVALTELYSREGIVSNALMPGRAHTAIAKHFPDAMQEALMVRNSALSKRFPNFIKTAEQAASTQVWAAVAPELDDVGGEYLENCGLSKRSTIDKIALELIGYAEFTVDKRNAIKLWNLSMEWLKNPPK